MECYFTASSISFQFLGGLIQPIMSINLNRVNRYIKTYLTPWPHEKELQPTNFSVDYLDILRNFSKLEAGQTEISYEMVATVYNYILLPLLHNNMLVQISKFGGLLCILCHYKRRETAPQQKNPINMLSP